MTQAKKFLEGGSATLNVALNLHLLIWTTHGNNPLEISNSSTISSTLVAE